MKESSRLMIVLTPPRDAFFCGRLISFPVLFAIVCFGVVGFAVNVPHALAAQDRPIQPDENTSINPGRQAKPGYRFVDSNSRLQYKLVSPNQDAGGMTSHGYRLIKIIVFNGDEAKHSVQLAATFRGERYGLKPVYCKNSNSAEIQLEPGAIATVRTYAPNLAAMIDSLHLIVDGQKKNLNSMPDIEHELGVPLTRQNLRSSSASILCALPPEDRFKLDPVLSQVGVIASINRNSTFSATHQADLGNLELMWAPSPDDWDDQWLGYTAYSNLLMPYRFFDQLSQAKKNAIRKYIAIGGMITFTQSESLPAEFKTVLLGDQSRRIIQTREKTHRSTIDFFEFGLGIINVTPDSIDHWEFENPSLDASIPDQVNWESIVNSFKRPTFYDGSSFTEAESSLPMVKEKKVGHGVIFWSVLVFILVVGPINYFIARLYFQNMMAVVFTTPLFSIAVTVLFVLADYFSQGLTPTTITECFTVLDQTDRQAYSVGTTGFYAPVRPKTLTFDMDTEVFAQSITNYDDSYDRYGIEPSPAEIEFRDNKQLLTSGWAKPRESVYFHFRQTARCDLRVTFEKTDDGNIRAINGLGVEIVKLAFCDPTGTLYTTENLLSGDGAILIKAKKSGFVLDDGPLPSRLRTLVPMKGRSVFGNMLSRSEIGKGHYIAETTQSVFVQPAQQETIEKPKTSFIYGIQGDLK